MTRKREENDRIVGSVASFYAAMARQPMDFVRHGVNFGNQMFGILGGADTADKHAADKRFSDPVWSSNHAYRALKNSYLSWCKSTQAWINDLDMDVRDKERIRLLAGTILDGWSPTNMLVGNPSAMKKTLETGGENILSGLRNLVSDLANNGAMPSSVDRSQFQVGENLGISKGDVVDRDELRELIQYKAQTDKVHGTPILIVPPQINKFYIWDLSPGRSLVEFLIQQGFSVFIVSWRNPGPKDAEYGLDDYVQSLDRASEVVSKISRAKKIHIAGACSGGISLSLLLSYWAAKGIDRAASATFLVTILDTDGASDTSMGLFANLEILTLAKSISRSKGIVRGRDLARVFALLRPNDLIWAYWVNNYLMGETPPAFDILYWNDDTTNMTASLHGDYIALLEENGIKTRRASVLNEQVDLSRVTCDSFVLGGSTDHITPWKGCYRTVEMLGGKSEFVLSSSGHIQAIVNPPSNQKAKFRTMDELPKSTEAFLENSSEIEGTWWLHWAEWLKQRSQKEKAAPGSSGNAEFMPLCAAPGKYVLEGES
ncbi:PHA/PHB synthase family protein [Hoeflea poritis]|uniref:Alpha/beta fold hydrolase n=1 Tax=Hoeflea poritis TaxID=2993659 RepID=A0ABT4VLV6_9HYPH|nr:alpha/beta fold hydrolase [Hoeflea poritis]MDA4845145.1 alpha/beta fold hydrolase [Hoeflea poritis]